MPFFCRPFDLLPELTLRSCLFGFQPSGITYNGASFRLPFPVPLRFPFRDSLPRYPCGFHFWEATTLKRTLSTFWLSGHHRIAPCLSKLRPIYDADLAIRSIWLPIRLRTFGLFHHFWVTLYGWPDWTNLIHWCPFCKLFRIFLQTFFKHELLTIVNNFIIFK